MKQIIFITLAFSITILNCTGQTKNSEEQPGINTPGKNIIVNKEYDDNGNLIRYDSTYSYYYSNVKENAELRDSIFNNFRNYFDQNYYFSNQPFFKDFFFQDSLLMYDFYKKDFFYDRFRNNMQWMDSLFREMDVFKNDFFRKQTLPVIK